MNYVSAIRYWTPATPLISPRPQHVELRNPVQIVMPVNIPCLMLHPPSNQFRSIFHKVTAILTNISADVKFLNTRIIYKAGLREGFALNLSAQSRGHRGRPLEYWLLTSVAVWILGTFGTTVTHWHSTLFPPAILFPNPCIWDKVYYQPGE